MAELLGRETEFYLMENWNLTKFLDFFFQFSEKEKSYFNILRRVKQSTWAVMWTLQLSQHAEAQWRVDFMLGVSCVHHQSVRLTKDPHTALVFSFLLSVEVKNPSVRFKSKEALGAKKKGSRLLNVWTWLISCIWLFVNAKPQS